MSQQRHRVRSWEISVLTSVADARGMSKAERDACRPNHISSILIARLSAAATPGTALSSPRTGPKRWNGTGERALPGLRRLRELLRVPCRARVIGRTELPCGSEASVQARTWALTLKESSADESSPARHIALSVRSFSRCFTCLVPKEQVCVPIPGS